MSSVRRPASIALAVLLVALPAAAAKKPYGGESPQDVVARLKAAAERQDMGEVMACLDPDSRREMAMMMVAGVGMMVAFSAMGTEMAGSMAEALTDGVAEGADEEAAAEAKADVEEQKRAAQAKAEELAKQYEAILVRHHVTEAMNDETPVPSEPQARRAALAKALADTDEIALISDLMAMMSSLGGSEGMKSSPVDLGPEVTDYRIEGDRATAKAGDETVRFVKTDGRWYVLPEEEAAAEGLDEAESDDGSDIGAGSGR